jgi:hypothetical protein
LAISAQQFSINFASYAGATTQLASCACKQDSPAAKLDDHVFLDKVFLFADYLSLGYI